MKFAATFFTLGFALCAVAEPIPKHLPSKRDVAAFRTVIANINAQVLVVDAAVTAFTGGDGAAVQSASDQLVSIINAGVTTANAQPNLSFSETLSLTQPILDLTDDVNAVVDKLIAKEPAFISAGLADDVLLSLQQQKTASEALAAAITAKVPDLLKGIAADLAAGIAEALQRGIDAYSD
jgi:hypothetical protein